MAPRAHRPGARLALVVVAALSLAAGCSEDEPAAGGSPDVPAPVAAAVPDALVAATWPVLASDDAARAPFESHPGWGATFRREPVEALTAFGADPGSGRALARTHADLAAVYRQAALMAANATSHVYGDDRVAAVDPVEADYVLGVSLALLDRCDEARAALAAEGLKAGSALAPGLAWWTAQAADAPCGDQVSLELPAGVIPWTPGAVAPGTQPADPASPHHRFQEQGDGGGAVDVSDPAVLLAMSKWHEAAARAAAPEGEAAIIDALLQPWRLPGERGGGDAVPDTVDLEWLFASFALAPADLPFLAEAAGSGAPAVDTWKDRSPLAAALAPAIQDGKVVPELVLDRAADVGQQLEAAMAAKSGGEQGYHRPFGQIARVAVLRAGMVVADGTDQYRDAGILRVNALERSTGPVADPVFSMSVAAWDAGNRNPLRAQELVHAIIKTLPAVEGARAPLDALHIRLSRNTSSGGPVF